MAGGAGVAGGAAGGGGVAGAWRRFSPRQRTTALAAGVMLAAAAVAISLIAFVPGTKPAPGTNNAAATGHESSGNASPASPPSSGARAPGSHKAGHHKTAKHHHKAKPAKPHPKPKHKPKKPPKHHPAPGPKGIAKLTAGVSVSGPPRGGRDARVTFAATNIGTAPTNRLSGLITLPAGAVLAHDWELNGGGGWDCHSGGHQVVCSHGPVPKENQVVGSFSIVVRSATACGQPVTFTVDGGTPRTRAGSSALIQCSKVSFGARGLFGTAATTLAAQTLPAQTLPAQTAGPSTLVARL